MYVGIYSMFVLSRLYFFLDCFFCMAALSSSLMSVKFRNLCDKVPTQNVYSQAIKENFLHNLHLLHLPRDYHRNLSFPKPGIDWSCFKFFVIMFKFLYLSLEKFMPKLSQYQTSSLFAMMRLRRSRWLNADCLDLLEPALCRIFRTRAEDRRYLFKDAPSVSLATSLIVFVHDDIVHTTTCRSPWHPSPSLSTLPALNHPVNQLIAQLYSTHLAGRHSHAHSNIRVCMYVCAARQIDRQRERESECKSEREGGSDKMSSIYILCLLLF